MANAGSKDTYDLAMNHASGEYKGTLRKTAFVEPGDIDDAFLREQGWRVLRFRNNDVLHNPEGVGQSILAALCCDPPAVPPTYPPPQAGEG